MPKINRPLLLSVVLLAMCCVCSYAQTQAPDAARQVTSGRIKVNGQEVPPGYAVPPDSLVEAAHNSSAVVSLGKLGRVEVLPSTKMKITYDDMSFSIALESGGARVFKSQGASAKVTTKNGDVIADTPLAATFTVDTECGNTVVAAHFATVQLRSSKGVRTISHGAEGSSGEPRPDCQPRTKLKSRIKSRP